MQQIGVREDLHGAEFSNKSKNQLLEALKNLSIPIHGTRGYAKAEVTAGGVSLSEVNFQDMQSRKHPGLFFAGEILDLDGPIGGFNFRRHGVPAMWRACMFNTMVPTKGGGRNHEVIVASIGIRLF